MRALHAVPTLALLGALAVPASPTPAVRRRLTLGRERPVAVASPLRISRLFGDGMVIQRGIRVPVWGRGSPGAAVQLTFDGRRYATSVDSSGGWVVTLPAMGAGGPHAMTVSSESSSLTVSDILVGDVWICSGQSNMEFALADASNGASAIAAAHDSAIREFKVPRSWAMTPDPELAGGSWHSADPAHAGSFTAVGYFFARELRQREHVPIGLINATWGGTRIESWMRAGALHLDSAALAALIERDRADEEKILAGLRERIGVLPDSDAGFAGGAAPWADPSLDDARWGAIPVPALWESAGYEGMDGIAWYRTSFELTADEARRGVRLGLGMIDDSDISWVNGVQVGRMTSQWNVARRYDVPPNALRAGRNVIAVRVEDTGGGGGIYGDSALLYVETNGARRPLAGSWKFRVGAVSVSLESRKSGLPTALYNKMVNPLVRFPVKGVIWYQGEANADQMSDAVAYRTLFPAMITDWRAAFGNARMPFLWVQLPNYMAPVAEPGESNWATLRESQHAALALPATGEAVTIDLGEANDIHPKNKQDVGSRLAIVASRVAYGRTGTAASPKFRRMTRRASRVIIEMAPGGGSLTLRGDSTLAGFAIAGADHRFVRAQAMIDGDRVVVWSPEVAEPVAVRYAWADNPAGANLYNSRGLPATPFRTDAW